MLYTSAKMGRAMMEKLISLDCMLHSLVQCNLLLMLGFCKVVGLLDCARCNWKTLQFRLCTNPFSKEFFVPEAMGYDISCDTTVHCERRGASCRLRVFVPIQEFP